jgi:hypothetical protein
MCRNFNGSRKFGVRRLKLLASQDSDILCPLSHCRVEHTGLKERAAPPEYRDGLSYVIHPVQMI